MNYLYLTIVTLLLLAAAFFSQRYKIYLKAGPGGFGQTPFGFLRCMSVKFLLFIHRYDNLDVSDLQEHVQRGGLYAERWLTEKDVPVRAGEREPLCPYPTPQRHLVSTDFAGVSLESRSQDQLNYFVTLPHIYPEKVIFGSSHIERIGPALFAHPSVPNYEHLDRTRREICHIHIAPFSFCCDAPPTPPPQSDFITGVVKPYTPAHPPPAPQSLHILLSPGDAAFVIERKWAVRHVAGGRPPWPLVGLPSGFVFVYAPRNKDEEETVRAMCRAAIEFATSVKHGIAENVVGGRVVSEKADG
ncbi:hypothetical protein P7C70_g3884, partial [Phenoliferia sp. Uapishka_3]